MSTPRAERPITVLLIDDQAIVGEAVRGMLSGEAGIQFHFCQEPAKALETANAVQPTVILQDLVMPDVDGLLLVKFFRANPATRQTPMIVLSSKEEPTIKARAFAMGANDYLVKLPDRLELVARVRYHSRSYLAQLERDEAYRQLEESKRILAEEVAQAARYVRSLLPPPQTEPVATDWRFVPSTQLGGDMFGYHWLDPDRLAMYLLDVSGHGVGSSLLAVSAANLLATRSLPGVDFGDPGRVLERLNNVFPMENQDNKYFTMWYGVYDRRTRTLSSSNAGHPPALVFTGAAPDRAVMHSLKAGGPVIGAVSDMEFESEVVQLEEHARLLIYSDGVFEVERPDGTMWQLTEFLQYVQGLAADGGPVLDRVLTHVRAMRGVDMLADDFSMVEVRF